MSLKLSVIMPVFNSAMYLRETLDSILNQTFTDFELIIINDNSSDESEKIIFEYIKTDDRIIYYSQTTNKGPANARNKGIELAKGKYIALNDADDISELNRFEKQINFLNKNPSINVCASWYTEFGINIKKNLVKSPIENEDIKIAFLTYDCIGNSTVMMRNEVMTNNRFDINFKVCEDYKLWSELLLDNKFYTIPESLVKYRVHEQGISKLKKSFIAEYDKIIKLNYIRNTLLLTDNKDNSIFKIFNREKNQNENELKLIIATGENLINQNDLLKNFDKQKFENKVTKGIIKSLKKGVFTKKFLFEIKEKNIFFYKKIPLYIKALLFIKAKNN